MTNDRLNAIGVTPLLRRNQAFTIIRRLHMKMVGGPLSSKGPRRKEWGGGGLQKGELVIGKHLQSGHFPT